MTHSDNMETEPNSDIRDCLNTYGISSRDYHDLIYALFMAAPKEPAAHAEFKLDRQGSPISSTFVSRVFNGTVLAAEDRGTVYAVWVSRINDQLGTKEIVGFAQIPWGQK